MTNAGAVVVPRNVFAKLPSYNPYVGTFHHAPRYVCVCGYVWLCVVAPAGPSL